MQPASAAGPLKGATLSPLPTYQWKQHPKTLVLAMREGCHFCQQSLPFYKHLSDLQSTHKLGAHLLVVTPDDKATADKTMFSSGISTDVVSQENLSDINVSGTPTLLLVNGNGKVEQAWIGKQTPAGEAAIIDAANQLDAR